MRASSLKTSGWPGRTGFVRVRESAARIIFLDDHKGNRPESHGPGVDRIEMVTELLARSGAAGMYTGTQQPAGVLAGSVKET